MAFVTVSDWCSSRLCSKRYRISYHIALYCHPGIVTLGENSCFLNCNIPICMWSEPSTFTIRLSSEFPALFMCIAIVHRCLTLLPAVFYQYCTVSLSHKSSKALTCGLSLRLTTGTHWFERQHKKPRLLVPFSYLQALLSHPVRSSVFLDGVLVEGTNESQPIASRPYAAYTHSGTASVREHYLIH